MAKDDTSVSRKLATTIAEHLVGKDKTPDVHDIDHWHSQFIVEKPGFGPYESFRVEVHAID